MDRESFKISKYSYTVVRGTWAAWATLVKLTIVPLHNAATVKIAALKSIGGWPEYF